MCTAPPTLHRSAHITRFRAQSLIVCCPTAFRPDFRRRLPDPDLRSSRVRRRVLRRLKVRLTPRAHSTAARPAEPTPLARSRTHQPFPHSPSLPSVRSTLPSGGPFWSLRPSTQWLRPGFTPGDGPLNLPLNPPRQSVQALGGCVSPPSPLPPLSPPPSHPAPGTLVLPILHPPAAAIRAPPSPAARPSARLVYHPHHTTAVSSSLTAAAVSAAAAATRLSPHHRQPSRQLPPSPSRHLAAVDAYAHVPDRLRQASAARRAAHMLPRVAGRACTHARATADAE